VSSKYILRAGDLMYVVKVLHGYIDKEGQRTREKAPEKLWVFQSKQESDHFATKIGGRSKHISKIRKD
ncbi:hypothetical protein HMPREF3146_06545, partial [Enterococcus sp. HMSC05C03]